MINNMSYQYHDESIVTELPEDTVLYLAVTLAMAYGDTVVQHDIGSTTFCCSQRMGRGWAGQSLRFQHSMNIYSKCHYHKLSIM